MRHLVKQAAARLAQVLIYALAYCLKLVIFVVVSVMQRSAARSAARVLRALSAATSAPTARPHNLLSASQRKTAHLTTAKLHTSRPTTLPNAAPSSSSASSSSTDTTHFGFTDVPRSDKERLVGDVFHRVASTYDVMNDLMSLGIHRVWKHRLISLLAPTQHTQLLDVAGGTGDIAFRFIESVRAIPVSAYQRAAADGPAVTAAVTVCDINPSMLAVGKERAIQYSYLSDSAATAPPSSASRVGISFVEGNAETLPFADNSFDAYTIAFGLRNVTNTSAALSEARRVLRPGGVFHCLEFSKLSLPLLQQLYDAYSFNVIPALGAVVASDRASYKYLVESISKWHSQESLAQLMVAAGMKAVSFENLTFGIAAIHTGYKV